MHAGKISFQEMKSYILIAISLILASSALAADPSFNRPGSWAQPVELTGVPNLYKVGDRLYRSAQPTAQGMHNLKGKGIKTIINLRSFHSDRDEVGDTELGYEHIYMKAWYPEQEDIIRFLQIMINPKRTPVLVHCQHGADRTGTMCALYRIVVEGWTKEEAIREMTQGGFGFHEILENLPEWVQKLDIDAIRKDSGIKTGKEAGAEGDPVNRAP